jgi:hypothetical protein
MDYQKLQSEGNATLFKDRVQYHIPYSLHSPTLDYRLKKLEPPFLTLSVVRTKRASMVTSMVLK